MLYLFVSFLKVHFMRFSLYSYNIGHVASYLYHMIQYCIRTASDCCKVNNAAADIAN